LNVFAEAIPKLGALAARDEPTHALPDIANVVAPVVRFALVVGRCDAEFKLARHGWQMRDNARWSLSAASRKIPVYGFVQVSSTVTTRTPVSVNDAAIALFVSPRSTCCK
ncbi:MAG: hypothetical protein WBP75_12690, partial [Candidatus Cybelea sp.]